MTASTFWSVEVMVEVRDPQALFAAALASHEGEGGGDHSHLVDADGQPDIGTCLRQIIDPSGIDGCKVIMSMAEEGEP